MPDKSTGLKDLVFRLDFYVGERDLFGIGFSDNVVFRKQYYLRAVASVPLELFLLTDERFMDKSAKPAEPPKPLPPTEQGWTFEVGGTGFKGTFQVEIDDLPDEGAIPFQVRFTTKDTTDTKKNA
jgi:hypothetical protein